MANIRVAQDLVAGAVFGAIGGAGLYIALGYSIGSIAKMGPGYFPAVLSGLILLIGIWLLIRGSRQVEGEQIGIVNPRAFALILLSLIVFGLTIAEFGLILAVSASTALASLAYGRMRAVELVVLCAALSVFTAVLFVFLLKLPIPLLPPRLDWSL